MADENLTVGVLVGSLRRDSLTRKLAGALVALAPAELTFTDIAIGDLAHYNPDLDGDGAPTPWQRLRHEVRAADALLFVTPEYNWGVPGVLKNALEIASRPYGHGAWQGRPALIVSGSPSSRGGAYANQSLHHLLAEPLGVPVMPGPDICIGQLDELFAADGSIVSADQQKLLRGVMAEFAGWAARICATATD